MVTWRRFECFSWSLGPAGSQRCCWTVRASMTKRAKTYAAVINSSPWKMGRTMCLLLPLQGLFSLQVESFRVSALKWLLSPGAAPRTGAAQDMLGNREGGGGGVEGSSSTSPAHPQQSRCRTCPVSCCTGCMGPRNKRLPVLCWQRWASSAAAGDRERGTEVPVVAVRNEARENFSMPVTSGQNTTVAKAGRKGLSQFSHKSFIAPFMRARKNHPL